MLGPWQRIPNLSNQAFSNSITHDHFYALTNVWHKELGKWEKHLSGTWSSWNLSFRKGKRKLTHYLPYVKALCWAPSTIFHGLVKSLQQPLKNGPLIPFYRVQSGQLKSRKFKVEYYSAPKGWKCWCMLQRSWCVHTTYMPRFSSSRMKRRDIRGSKISKT